MNKQKHLRSNKRDQQNLGPRRDRDANILLAAPSSSNAYVSGGRPTTLPFCFSSRTLPAKQTKHAQAQCWTVLEVEQMESL